MPPSAHADMRLTYDDLEYFPEDGKRREIIDGDLYVTPSPSLRHQVLVGRLHVAIANYLAGRPGIGMYFSHRWTSCCRPTTSLSPTSCSSGAISWTCSG